MKLIRPFQLDDLETRFETSLYQVLFLSASFAVLFSYYKTGAPGAWWGDGLELSAAAKVLGIPHPPGYPLYMLIGYSLSMGSTTADPGKALTLLSAFFCAASAQLIGHAAFRLMNTYEFRTGIPRTDRPLLTCNQIAAVGILLVFAFSRTVWEHATFAEVYPLTWFLGAGVLLVIVGGGAREQSGEGEGTEKKISLWSVLLLGFLCGLAALNHYSILAFAPLALFAVIDWGRRAKKLPLYLASFIAVFAVCLLGYLYLPIRARANPPINWGNPVDLEGVLWMLRGGDYVGMNVPRSASHVWEGFMYWLGWWPRQLFPQSVFEHAGAVVGFFLFFFAVILPAGGIVGCVLLARRWWALGWGLVAAIVITLLFSILYPIPDRDAYLVLALPAVLMGWTFFMRKLLEKGLRLSASERAGPPAFPESAAKPRLVTIIGSVFPLLLGIALVAAHYRSIDKSWDDGPREWARHVLNELPENAILLTRQAHDSEIYALWYEQIVNEIRPDVTVFGTGFIFSGWYQKYFEVTGRPKLPLFITERAPGSKEVYDVALVAGVIGPNIGTHRVFVTAESYSSEAIDPLIRQMSPRPFIIALPEEYYQRTAYKLNPPGQVIFEIEPDANFIRRAEERFVEIFGQAPPGAE